MEKDNIINHPNGTIIINGGNPLKGCPKDWDEAKLIEENLNKNKYEYEPQWKFDCGFKLDFDGSLLRVCSRFYPPKTHYGENWDGTVTFYFLESKIYEKKFDCKTLDELQKQVEKYVEFVTNNIKSLLNP